MMMIISEWQLQPRMAELESSQSSRAATGEHLQWTVVDGTPKSLAVSLGLDEIQASFHHHGYNI